MAEILVINPNSSASMTRSMAGCLEIFNGIGPHSITCTELAKSPRGIETDAHVSEVIPHIIEAVGATSAHAIVLACFSDPGIDTVRRCTSLPVIGIAEAAYLAALGLGKRFGIVSLGSPSIARHHRYLCELKLQDRLAGDRSLDTTIVDLIATNVIDKVSRIGAQLRDEDGADVIILGCAGLGAYRKHLQEALGLPVIDPVQAAVALACTQLDLGYRGRAG
ncbi:hydantoin racemase [Mesorhizobium sp. NBSH29]|uniref:aspartate/glutamate racemase family protein n=1 Tax=Mesorhizobium sp. NBSH29 TaxID=2654249 RepID=UPI001896863C|nr:aspartate/glutamate racemase family protein [Mesorhizobium sp. NBSH29]QPC85486.1 hydantoin racemase [Mesorhizobium sp. NBSH29]